MPKMQTSFNGLVRLLAKNLYSSADVFVRELIQNAHDGCQRLAAAQPECCTRIDITTSPDERTITFADNGIGMDETDIHAYLSTIGQSGTATESAKLNSAGFTPETIGQFGVGLLSAFVVAEQIDVFTRKLGSPTGYHWVSHGGDEYQVTPTADAPDIGTEITLTLKTEYLHFLQEEELLRIIRLYADFLGVPIYVNGEGPVNLRAAPWHVATWASEIERGEACRRFLDRRYHDRALLVIPVDIAEPRARGVLYITDQPLPGVGANGSVDIYVRRMCIRLNDAELLPDWATFVRGILDVELQPTAARDNVQRDGHYHRLRRALGDTIIKALLTVQRDDLDYFHRICNWHQVGIKGMALRDEAFFAAVADHLPFHTNAGTRALAQYLQEQKPLPSGRKPIYYFGSQGDEGQFFQICSANGLVAINAGRYFDVNVLEKYADLHHQTVELRRLDHLNSTQLYAMPDAATAVSFQPMLAALKEVLTEQALPNITPVIRQFAPDSLACVLIDDAGRDALDRFDVLLESPYVPSSIQALAAEISARIKGTAAELILNANNPLVQSLRTLPRMDHPSVCELLLGLYHLALLNSQRRVKSETARLIDGYVQSRMAESLRLRQQAEDLAQQIAAWRQCTSQAAGASAADWATIMKDLVGTTPGELRARITKASDAELGELVLDLYRNMQRE